MKLPLKYIVVLVLTALVCIFAYQAYWLVGLYQSQKKEMDMRIILTSAILTFQQPPKNKSPLFIGISKFF